MSILYILSMLMCCKCISADAQCSVGCRREQSLTLCCFWTALKTSWRSDYWDARKAGQMTTSRASRSDSRQACHLTGLFQAEQEASPAARAIVDHVHSVGRALILLSASSLLRYKGSRSSMRKLPRTAAFHQKIASHKVHAAQLKQWVLQVFLDSSMPVIKHYDGKGKLRRFDATPPPSEVFEQVKKLFIQTPASVL